MFGSPGQVYEINGRQYQADGSGRIDGVDDGDVPALQGMRCRSTIGDVAFFAGSVASGVEATGSTIYDAQILPDQFNIIIDSSPGSGVILPRCALIGSGLIVNYNISPNLIKVYSVDEPLDGFTPGTPALLPVGHLGFYFATGSDNPTYVSSTVATQTAGAAGGFDLIGKLIHADMNTVSDEPVTMCIGPQSTFRIRQITVVNASGQLDVAVGGIYTDQNKGGSALVDGAQAYAALSSPDSALDLTIVSTPGNTIWPGGTQLYKSLSLPQGVATTADFYFYGSVA
jgi:hypothetical protein